MPAAQGSLAHPHSAQSPGVQGLWLELVGTGGDPWSISEIWKSGSFMSVLIIVTHGFWFTAVKIC